MTDGASRVVILRGLLSHGPSFASSIKANAYWKLVDWCASGSADVRDYFSRPEDVVLFVGYCDCLVAAFGKRRVLCGLRQRYRTKA